MNSELRDLEFRLALMDVGIDPMEFVQKYPDLSEDLFTEIYEESNCIAQGMMLRASSKQRAIILLSHLEKKYDIQY